VLPGFAGSAGQEGAAATSRLGQTVTCPCRLHFNEFSKTVYLPLKPTVRLGAPCVISFVHHPGVSATGVWSRS
jgi:hypothetical protein